MNGAMRILVEKKIFNFSLQDIKNLAKEFLLKTRYEENLDGAFGKEQGNELKMLVPFSEVFKSQVGRNIL